MPALLLLAHDKSETREAGRGSTGMLLPGIYIACHFLQKPLNNWLRGVTEYRGYMLSRLHSEGQFTVHIIPEDDKSEGKPLA